MSGRGRTLGREILEFEVLSEAEARDAGDYDDVSRQWKVKATTDGVGETARATHTSIKRVPGQFSTGGDFFRQIAAGGGDVPKVDAVILIHRRDLVRCGLWHETDEKPLLQPNDRLKRILNRRGDVIFNVPDNPGLYVSQVNPWVSDGDIIRFDLMGRPEGTVASR